MNILVPVRHVVDVELTIRIKEGKVVEDGLQYAMSAWDENALEAAVQIKEDKEADITVVAIGDDSVLETLRKGLAMGADKAIHVKDEAGGHDSYSLAQALKQVVEKESYDLILMGKQAQDTDNYQTGIMLAELLGIPCISNTVEIVVESDKELTVTKGADVGKEKYSLQLPAVITASDSLNEPRLPSLRGIMKAKKKPVTDIEGLFEGTSSRSQIVEFQEPAGRAAGTILEGDAEEITAKVVQLLKNEAKII